MAISPNTMSLTVARAVKFRHAANAARKLSAAEAGERGDFSVSDPYAFMAIPLDEAENIGGEWQPHIALPALRASSLDGGWSGWEDEDTPPWSGNQLLEFMSSGGIEVRERIRDTVAAQHYMSAVGGDIHTRIGGNCSVHVKRDGMLSIDGSGGDQGGEESEEGEEGEEDGGFSLGGGGGLSRLRGDILHVKGDARVHSGEKMVMGACDVERRWEGAILRMIGMEGTICGGIFLKTFFGGISTTMAPLVSGDVYGGAAHAAGARVRASATMGYRSSEMAAWACTFYVRKAWTVIEPLPGSLTNDPARTLSEKMGRILLGTNPILDIMWGVLFMPMAVISLIGAIKNKIQGKKSPPPEGPGGPPRTRTRVVGATMQTSANIRL